MRAGLFARIFSSCSSIEALWLQLLPVTVHSRYQISSMNVFELYIYAKNNVVLVCPYTVFHLCRHYVAIINDNKLCLNVVFFCCISIHFLLFTFMWASLSFFAIDYSSRLSIEAFFFHTSCKWDGEGNAGVERGETAPTKRCLRRKCC
uniref:Uncharacterized protein n=1 Tax=Parascaris univalens TaxID=6257 RepID=A0A915BIR1_PARUN